MPAPIDLRGRVFGELTVLARAGKVKFGDWQYGWRCQCSCGRIEIIPQKRLPYRASIPASHAVTACEVCRRPKCAVCGDAVPLARGKKNTCSEPCEVAKNRANGRAHYHRQMSQDPDHAMKAHRRKRQRMLDDPEYAARTRQQWREQSRRQKANMTPEQREREREYHRRLYYDNRDLILSQRKARLAAMTPEERVQHDEEARRRGREWRRQWRAWLERHPEEKAKHQQRYREWVRARELRDLVTALEKAEKST